MSAAVEYTPELLKSLADGSHNLERWRARGWKLARHHSRLQFAIGDWLAEGTKWSRDVYAEALEIFKDCDYTKETMQTLRSVAVAVEPSIRVKDLSFAHHRAVMRFEPDEQRELLRQAAERGLNLRDFKSYIVALFAAKPAPEPSGTPLNELDPEPAPSDEPKGESEPGPAPKPGPDSSIRIALLPDVKARVDILVRGHKKPIAEIVNSLLDQALELPGTQSEIEAFSQKGAV